MANYYVSLSGNDANDGSMGSPWLHISVAVSRTYAGDTLYVRGGTYTGTTATINTIANTVNSGTSYSNAVTIAAYPTETPIIYPNSAVDGIHLESKQYIIFQGLTVDLGATTNGSNEAVFLYLSDHIKFVSCDLMNGPSFGVHVADTTPYTWMQNCLIHGFSRAGSSAGMGHGLYISGSDGIFEGCEVYDNDGYGFHIYGNINIGHQDPSRVTCRNNFVHDNGVHNTGEAGILIAWGSDNVVYNNVVYDCPSGIHIYTSQTNGQAYNNTVYNCTPFQGVLLQYYASAPIVQNNIVYNCASGIVDADSGSGTPVISYNLTTDPDFVDASTHNFRLSLGSDAIDAGTTIAIVTTDITGLSRPQGSAYCIGAYEFVPSGTGWTRVGGAVGNGDTVSAEVGPINTTGAELFVASIAWYAQDVAQPTLTDSENNTWTILTKQQNVDPVTVCLYYCMNPDTSASHTFETSDSDAFYPALAVEAWQCSDDFAFAGETGSFGVGSATIQPGSITPSFENSLIVTGLAFGYNVDYDVTVDSGFSAHVSPFDIGISEGGAIATLVQGAIAAVNPEWDVTFAPLDGLAAAMAYFAQSAIVLEGDPCVATWTVPSSTLTLGTATVSGTAALASWVVPASALTSSGTATLAGASCVAAWVVPVSSITGGGGPGEIDPAISGWPRRT